MNAPEDFYSSHRSIRDYLPTLGLFWVLDFGFPSFVLSKEGNAEFPDEDRRRPTHTCSTSESSEYFRKKRYDNSDMTRNAVYFRDGLFTSNGVTKC